MKFIILVFITLSVVTTAHAGEVKVDRGVTFNTVYVDGTNSEKIEVTLTKKITSSSCSAPSLSASLLSIAENDDLFLVSTSVSRSTAYCPNAPFIEHTISSQPLIFDSKKYGDENKRILIILLVPSGYEVTAKETN